MLTRLRRGFAAKVASIGLFIALLAPAVTVADGAWHPEAVNTAQGKSCPALFDAKPGVCWPEAEARRLSILVLADLPALKEAFSIRESRMLALEKQAEALSAEVFALRGALAARSLAGANYEKALEAADKRAQHLEKIAGSWTSGPFGHLLSFLLGAGVTVGIGVGVKRAW